MIWNENMFSIKRAIGVKKLESYSSSEFLFGACLIKRVANSNVGNSTRTAASNIERADVFRESTADWYRTSPDSDPSSLLFVSPMSSTRCFARCVLCVVRSDYISTGLRAAEQIKVNDHFNNKKKELCWWWLNSSRRQGEHNQKTTTLRFIISFHLFTAQTHIGGANLLYSTNKFNTLAWIHALNI